ncbi:single-stranded DNA-binding protein 2-like [Bufo gargarizans]|uniref:single-stranded DNA-binding protein 2-like n=1 Tax=Bufo gargarizans TaxID=30331 RepID=UPI001CF16082|nr:single-stranded DNA-binding protein 2-like [Bufo gargarizans]
MYAKGKSNSVPSDSQAREKLALYVYEYLLHVGAQKSAQTFLSEIRWEKNITLGEPQDSYTLGGAYFGICTVLLQRDEKPVNIQVKRKPFMIIALQLHPVLF